MEGLKKRESVKEPVKRFEPYQNLIMVWKMEFVDKALKAYDSERTVHKLGRVDIKDLYQNMGRLEMERDFLLKVNTKPVCEQAKITY